MKSFAEFIKEVKNYSGRRDSSVELPASCAGKSPSAAFMGHHGCREGIFIDEAARYSCSSKYKE